jgi:RNA recognition motif-containing protein
MLRLFVGNIPHACDEAQLQEWFEQQGYTVQSTQIIHDRLTGHSRGLGFVQLEDTTDLANTIERLNGQRLLGRVLTVGEAIPKVMRGGGMQQTA